MLEGPQTIAGFIIEPVTGTNGILIPPDGYIQGVRALCDKHGILLICDEVMSGFGRTGEWFAVDHWKVVPDMITMAKGLTSAYVPLGAVGMRRKIADHFKDKVFYGGLTYNSHPLGCAAALATIAVYEEDNLIENARSDGRGDARAARGSEGEASVASATTRIIGLFGIVELVRESRDDASRWRRSTARSPEMQALGKFFREEGLYTFVRWNTLLHQSAAVHHRSGAARGVRDHRQRPHPSRRGHRVHGHGVIRVHPAVGTRLRLRAIRPAPSTLGLESDLHVCS